MAREIPIGRVVDVSPRGTILVKAPAGLPVQVGGRRDGLRIGYHAADARREPVGRVVDIIGPVASPYVLVQPERGAKLHRLVGKDLFTAAPGSSQPRPSRPTRPSDQQGRQGGWKPRRGGQR